MPSRSGEMTPAEIAEAAGPAESGERPPARWGGTWRQVLRNTWRRPRVRAWTWQVLAVLLLAAAIAWVAGNVAVNLPRLKMELRFGFLFDLASFEIGDNLIGYRAGESYWRAFGAGLGNTLVVAVLGIAITAVFGTLVALIRLSRNVLASAIAAAYVEVARNLPLLLQLLLWQTLLVRALPPPRGAWTPLPDVFLSNRGMTLPTLGWQGAYSLALGLLVVGAPALRWWRKRHASPVTPPSSAAWLPWLPWLVVLALPLLVIMLGAEPATVERPQLRGFNMVGGITVVPEFFALLFGLVFCHAAFAAESIRAGILGVPRGQWDAARSLGLRWWPTLRKVVLPQALRIIVPPLTSNFLSLTKSSSLAVAIGYPELVRVTTVAVSETGRAVECMTIMVAVYLVLSLGTSALMNTYNRRVALLGGVSA